MVQCIESMPKYFIAFIWLLPVLMFLYDLTIVQCGHEDLSYCTSQGFSLNILFRLSLQAYKLWMNTTTLRRCFIFCFLQYRHPLLFKVGSLLFSFKRKELTWNGFHCTAVAWFIGRIFSFTNGCKAVPWWRQFWQNYNIKHVFTFFTFFFFLSV